MNWELLDRQSARLYEDLYVLEILLNCWNKKRYWRFMQLSQKQKSMQTACENGEYRQRDLMKEFSVSVIFINSWKLNSILQECHSELNISNKKK